MSSFGLIHNVLACVLLGLLLANAVTSREIHYEQQRYSGDSPEVHTLPDTACGVGYCHIETRCVPSGYRDEPPNACWVCDPHKSRLAWTLSEDENCMQHHDDAAAHTTSHITSHATSHTTSHGGHEVHLDNWHLSLIIVGSILLVLMMTFLASYRMKRHLAKRTRVYPSHYIDVPHDRPLLKALD